MRQFINLIEAASRKIDWDTEWEAIKAEAKVLAKQRAKYPRPEDLAIIDRAREAIRHLEGEGGHCHSMAEWLANTYGWEQFSGTYLAPNGEPVCTTHFWNRLKDGTILDSTPDQHGEDARSIRLIKPIDPEYKRYTMEWGEDWNPLHPDFEHQPEVDHRDPSTFSGKSDDERQHEVRMQNGGDHYWYLKPAQRKFAKAYEKKERKYGM